MPGRLLELHVENFRSLRDVTVPLGPPPSWWGGTESESPTR